MRKRGPYMLWALLSMSLCANAGCGHPERVVVAAASDLTSALPELAAAFREKTGVEVVATFGASKLLATQIAKGAPFDVFMSANTAFVDDVIAAGRCDATTRAQYARGSLVSWSRDAAPPTLAELADGSRRVVIANPETTPYGAAAKAALERARVWDQVARRLVRAENVRQALEVAATGNADVAIVSASLVIDAGGHHTPVPNDLYRPIDQALVVCRLGEAGAKARAFARFVTSPEGRGILARWSLAPPDGG